MNELWLPGITLARTSCCFMRLRGVHAQYVVQLGTLPCAVQINAVVDDYGTLQPVGQPLATWSTK